jgi:hypothetical protein
MRLKWMLLKLDKLICTYLGLHRKEEINPKTVQMVDGDFFVGATIPFRRHTINESWEKFTTFDIEKINNENKEKLGISAGKVIAKNLTVSFDVPPIRE